MAAHAHRLLLVRGGSAFGPKGCQLWSEGGRVDAFGPGGALLVCLWSGGGLYPSMQWGRPPHGQNVRHV